MVAALVVGETTVDRLAKSRRKTQWDEEQNDLNLRAQKRKSPKEWNPRRGSNPRSLGFLGTCASVEVQCRTAGPRGRNFLSRPVSSRNI